MPLCYLEGGDAVPLEELLVLGGEEVDRGLLVVGGDDVAQGHVLEALTLSDLVVCN